MDMEMNDDTLKEILIEDEQEVLKGKKPRRGCLFRLLVWLILIMMALLAFIFVQQYLLDLEAEAIVKAARTATAIERTSLEEELEVPVASPFGDPITTETPVPTPIPTEDPSQKRTATVAAQLTEVADFQLTVTVQPGD
jgi:hypothetical protein